MVKSFGVDHTLVVEDYYQHDIKYQEKVDKIENRRLLAQDLGISVDPALKQLKLDFGHDALVSEANVHFYRPSDKGSDVNKSLSQVTGLGTIDIGQLKEGLWKIKVEWTDKDRTYFKEQSIYL